MPISYQESIMISPGFIRLINKAVFILVSCVILSSCKDKEGDLFRYVSPEKSNLKFENTVEETDDLNILDYLYFYNGGGLAVGDINNDSLPDIFFSANQGSNKLFLNKGDLNFEEISETAGVQGNSDWQTGAVMVDINHDGLLDIYVSAVVGINGFDGHNELYINNGDLTFSERSREYGLDLDTFSSSTAFLDYDKDGDLDLFILNHAVHTQNSFGKASLRYDRSYETGDRLMRNDNGSFTDVSEEAGIYGGINGYGLGVAIADFNQDGWPDIYVGNDFHEDDYYYLNQGDGTFKESLKDYFGHTSRFTMGSDVADINNDGWPDLMALDMLPEEESVLKASEGDDNIQTLRMRTEGYGYHYQFTRNMLYVNGRNNGFMETALYSGVAATDWSWSTLIEDFNQDGIQDIFVSNGIPKRPNDLDFIRFVSSDMIQDKISDTKLVDKEALDLMPAGKVHNYIFEGGPDLRFTDRSGKWIAKDTLVSGATAFADLDNDGDLDLVINNLNSPASLLENKTDGKKNFLKIKFRYSDKNPFGIGTKAISYHQGKKQYKELYTVRGFQASSEPLIHFGYGDVGIVDSLKIIWPDNTCQLVQNINTNQTLFIGPESTKPFIADMSTEQDRVFEPIEPEAIGLNFIHEEDRYLDFNRQKLIPYQMSSSGPAFAIGDLNDDGRQDIFFGSSKFRSSRVYLQKDSVFQETKIPAIVNDSLKEDVSALITDLNGDSKQDLFVGSGGADFFGKAPALLDSYYIQERDGLVKYEVPGLYENASVVIAHDYDDDGDIDIFVGNRMVTNDYGKLPDSYLLNNDEGIFSPVQTGLFSGLGMITDAIWTDFDMDDDIDLIVVGEWMSPIFLENNNGEFTVSNKAAENLNGLWQSISEFDIDRDGDPDYLLGNWGTNSKFRATSNSPLRMYYSDFDGDGQTETIVANAFQGEYYPLAGLDELGAQMVSLRKKFTSYSAFAGKPIKDIFEASRLSDATVYDVQELSSGYLKNNEGNFEFTSFPAMMQLSPILAFVKYDFDKDGKEEVLAGGNFFGVTPYHGRFDSFPGAIIKGEEEYISGHALGLDFMQRSVRHLSVLEVWGKTFLLATFNDDKIQLYQMNKSNEEK